MSTKTLCGPAVCVLKYHDAPSERSKRCTVGARYDYPENAKNCQAQLELGERSASAAYYVSEAYPSGKPTRGPTFTINRCESGDTFAWENKMKSDTASRACAAALTQKTGQEYETLETNPGILFADFTVSPKLSGSVFNDFAAILHKFQK